MKPKSEFNVPQLIPHYVKKNIQQVSLEYGLFSQMVKNKITVAVEVENSSKAKTKNQTEEKNPQQKMIALNINS